MKQELDRFALGQLLSRLANAGPGEAMSLVPPLRPGMHGRRIGMTGAPGAGKSTLTGHLALLRAADRRLGVLAVDPSSPHTGGAILGDRIRMDDLRGIEDLYIRSIGSRSASDGLSDNLPEMLDVMDAFGFDEVILETVGVGQAEVAARSQVDTLVLVLLPESGDVVQAMKAGIMEMADIYVVNKADLPGAHRMATDIKRIAALSRYPEGAWRPKVLLTSAEQPESIQVLSDTIDLHQEWLATSQDQRTREMNRARYRLRRLVERRATQVISQLDRSVLDMPIDAQLQHVLKEILDQEAGAIPSSNRL